MWSLLVGALLLCVCFEVLHAQVWSGLHSPIPLGGLSFDDMDDDMGEPDSLLLNCFSSFNDERGRLDNELAVTIRSQDIGFGDSLLAGFGGVGGLPYGPYGGYNPGGFGGGSGQGRTSKLSARIELFSANNGGKAFVVFTERARVNQGCSVENFGDIITRDSLARNDRSMGSRQGLGMRGGFGYGYGGAHGLGLAGGFGYGYGGYGGGLSSLYGLGLGIGAGFGMGNGMGLLPGHDLPSDGVVAELDITPGALAAADVDDIGFDDLSDLAGRGMLVRNIMREGSEREGRERSGFRACICSDVTYDWDWNPVCTEPFYSCCSLKFDDVGLTLVS
ncbi:hypothetical protein PoB_002384800 [Plakobranchus ocellatus]|uniref:Uncharacterized protein n=1 Tax=Plakobranchus ocellatus TaxID=259542 RepID=A0AAV3ZSC5_9GAST|nr:hypothetical protein PoB_002384800 [Plakobranchus ocellatus]